MGGGNCIHGTRLWHRYAVIRRRQTYEEMMTGDQFAEGWQTA
ncbi:MAG: hypothetical protein ACRETT_13525 [Steroidobacteraceae bacterium]